MGTTVAIEHGIRCPKCGNDEEIEISCQLWVQLVPDGAETVSQDNEWDSKSPCVCRKCKHQATVADFTIGRKKKKKQDEAAPDMVIASVDTRHFHFEGAGKTEKEAKDALRNALRIHAGQEQCMENFVAHFMEDVSVRVYHNGNSYRDQDVLKVKK